MGLGVVFYKLEVVGFADFADFVGVGALSVKVDYEYGFCAGGYCGFDFVGVYLVGVDAWLDEYGHETVFRDCEY